MVISLLFALHVNSTLIDSSQSRSSPFRFVLTSLEFHFIDNIHVLFLLIKKWIFDVEEA